MGRLWLPSSGAAGVSPAFAAWGSTTGADRILAVDTKGATAMTTETNGGSANNSTVLMRQYCYPLLPGVVFSTSQTVKGQVRASEAGATANAMALMAIRVMAPPSTVRATLVALQATTPLASEFATTLTNREFPRLSPVTLQANYVSVSDDYLVMEYGFHAGGDAEVGDVAFRFGDVAGTDLAEDESSTADNAPWIEFSGSLFPAGGVRAYILE